MSLVYVLWVAVTVFLIGFWAWTNYILAIQKKGWRAFAAKHKLRYKGNQLMDSPQISGTIDGYKVTIFATDHSENNARTRKVMSTIEISLQSIMPMPCAVASGGMVNLVEQLGLTQEFKPNSSDWDISYIARSSDREMLATYLTSNRILSLSKIMKRPRSWVILIFGGEVGLLRLDTSDALENPEKLTVLVNQMIQIAKSLEFMPGEEKLISSKRGMSDAQSRIAKIDDNKVYNTNTELKLEDE